MTMIQVNFLIQICTRQKEQYLSLSLKLSEGYNLVGEPYNYLNTPPTKKPKISTTTDRNGGGGGGGGGGTDEPDLGDRNRTDTTPDPFVNMKCPNKEIEQYALLLATRFNHDFEGEEQILWPARKGDIWKAELVDAVFHIAMNLLTQSFVPRRFLLLVREIAMYEFSNHWKRVKSHLPNFKQRLVMLDLARCDEMIGSSPPIINQVMHTQYPLNRMISMFLNVSFLKGSSFNFS